MFEHIGSRKRPGVLSYVVIGAFVVAAGAATVTLWTLRARGFDEPPPPLLQEASAAPAVREPLGADADPFRRILGPGLSLMVPGRPSAVRGGYTTGDMSGEDYGLWTIGWQSSEQPSTATLDATVAGMMKDRHGLGGAVEVKGQDIEAAGAPGRLYRVGIGAERLTVAFAYCGGRVIRIVTSDPDAASRMLATLTCTPDPDTDLDRDTVAFEIRPGWARSREKRRLLLRHTTGVLVRPERLPDGGSDAPLGRLVAQVFTGSDMKVPAAKPTRVAGSHLIWDAISHGQPAAVVAWECFPDAPKASDPGIAERHAVAALVLAPEGVSLQPGIELALTGRCLTPNQSPPLYPVEPT